MTVPEQPHLKTVLITGASVGIGRELARVFARASYDLVLVARNKEQLEALCKEIEKEYAVRAYVFSKDLMDPGAPKDIFDQLEKNGIEIDVLVNNAGVGSNGSFHRSDLRKQLDMIQLNVTALVDLTGRFLPGMVERRAGKVLNIASTAAFQPGPRMAVYYASKTFVVSFSEAIATELKNTGVTVTAFCPGPTKTEFHKRADMDQVKMTDKGWIMSARDVAVAAYQALMDGKRVKIPGVKNRVIAAGGHLMPNSIVTRVVDSINSKREHFRAGPE